MVMAVKRLLSRTYSVVLQLDEHLCIQEDAFELSSLLMQGADRSLKAQNLAKYLHAEEDRDMLKHFMHSQADDSAVAGPIYLKLRDASGRAIRTEIMYATFSDLEDRTQHLVGICEQSNQLDEVDEFQEAPNTAWKQRSPVKQKLKGLGSPATVEKQELKSESLERSETLSNSSAESSLPYLEFERTPMETRSLSLLNLVYSWNVQMPRVTCCEYHAAVKEVAHHVAKFRKVDCKRALSKDTIRQCFTCQCQECGVVRRTETEACNVCGFIDACVRQCSERAIISL
eukprot:TRINITY_DN7868_c0_g2_i1.p1 TRINITY_DN7868_c0_g2~~TRINITY_DN7868_c0_g2_i1.p1  ORF type:complete len:307 (+),score=39.43 TRINITY_DN7868_c0_g2_i1:66-923(+)